MRYKINLQSMIHQIVFIFSLLLFLFLLPSCTLFTSDDPEGAGSEEEEEYYATDDAIDDDVGSEESFDEAEGGEEEDIVYIDEEEEDEEDEEYLVDVEEEEGGGTGDEVQVEETDDDDKSVSEDQIFGSEGADATDDEYDEDEFFYVKDSEADDSGRQEKTVQPAPVKKWISYRKIKNQPYRKAGFLVNAVYIARSGDDIQSVSNKIFGSDQTNHLYVVNPHLKAREVKVGDKIYYQSPRRSEDSSQLLFYFEDQGIEPVYHQVQRGENIRTVASRLLGHANSWKEIWATNPELVSKLKVSQTRTIKYWSAEAIQQPYPPPSETTQPPSSNLEDEQEDPVDLPPLEDSITEPEGSTPPDTLEEGEQIKDQESSKDDISPEEGDDLVGGMSQNTAIGVVLALVTLICVLVIIKKRRKKREFDYTAANFEIDE